MHEYDTTLKRILTRPGGTLLTRLTGLTVTRWMNVELPEVHRRRADLLGETSDGRFIHVELQIANDPEMGQRMVEYAVAIRGLFRRVPEQLVLYVGQDRLNMDTGIQEGRLTFSAPVVDIRELDGDTLLNSQNLGDNVVAILTRLSRDIEGVRRILGRVAETDGPRRNMAIAELMLLSGLRKLGTVIEKEMELMPILTDIMDHEVIGRERRRGMVEGERSVVLRLIGKRFGPVPQWASARIESLRGAELEEVEMRILDAKSLEDLLR